MSILNKNSKNNKGFTLLELIASIGILAIILLIATISYTQVRKRILNSQYNNLKRLIEGTGVKYSSYSGLESFFVQDLIDEGLLETDDEENIYDPRDKSPLNCFVVTVSEDEHGNFKGKLLDGDRRTNAGVCDSSKLPSDTNSDIGITAVLTTGSIPYPGNGLYHPNNTYFPLIYNGWTRSNLTFTATFKNNKITEAKKQGGKFVWDGADETYYPTTSYNKVFPYTNYQNGETNIPYIYNSKFKVSFFDKDGLEYKASMTVKYDNEAPTIYEDKTKLANQVSENEWTRSKTIIVYASDKDGVGLDRIYIGNLPCSSMLTNSSLGQIAGPGMIHPVNVYGDIDENGQTLNICATDRLGNLTNGGTITVKNIDRTAPDVRIDAYLYDAEYGGQVQYYDTSLGSVTNTDMDASSYHPDTNGWTKVGHAYKISVSDRSSDSIEDTIEFDYNRMFNVNQLRPSYDVKTTARYYDSTSTTKLYSAVITGEGRRYSKLTACDKLGNCRVLHINNDFIDKSAPVNVKYNLRNNSATGTIRANENKWTNQNVWWGDFNATDTLSGVHHYEYNSGPECNNSLGVVDRDYYLYGGENATSPGYVNGANVDFCLRAVDRVGNKSDWIPNIYIRVDKTNPTNPTSHVRINSSTGTIRSESDQKKFTKENLWWGDFNATDTYSGVDHYEYNSGPNCDNGLGVVDRDYYLYGGENATSSGYKKGANIDFCLRSVDKAGNPSGWSRVYIRTDKEPPTNVNANVRIGSTTGTARTISQQQQWTSEDLFWTDFSATDSLSGVDHYEYNSGSACNNTNDRRVDQAFYHYSSTTNYDLCYRAYDVAGNPSEWKRSYIRVDKTKPYLDITTYDLTNGQLWLGARTRYDGETYNVNDTAGYAWVGHGFIFQWDGKDDNSGVSSVTTYWDTKYTYDDPGHNYGGGPSTRGKSSTQEISSPGFRRVRIIVEDAVGNVSTIYLIVKISGSPKCNFTVNHGSQADLSSTWYSGDYLGLTLNMTLPGSSASKYYTTWTSNSSCPSYSEPSSNVNTYKVDTPTKDTGRKICGYVKDSYGNVGSCSYQAFFDPNAPVITVKKGSEVVTSDFTAISGQTINFSCTDFQFTCTGGVACYSGAYTGVLEYSGTSKTGLSVSVWPTTTTTYTYTCYDIAGNRTVKTIKATIGGTTGGGGSSGGSGSSTGCSPDYDSVWPTSAPGSCPHGYMLISSIPESTVFGCKEEDCTSVGYSSLTGTDFMNKYRAGSSCATNSQGQPYIYSKPSRTMAAAYNDGKVYYNSYAASSTVQTCGNVKYINSTSSSNHYRYYVDNNTLYRCKCTKLKNGADWANSEGGGGANKFICCKG